MALLDDWKAALVDGSDIDPFEFSTLIPLDASETYLRDAFGTHPNAHKMIEKIRVLLAENAMGGAYVMPRAENAIGEKACIELANAYRLEIRTFLSASGKGDLAKDLDGDDIILIHDIAEFNSLSTSPNYTHFGNKKRDFVYVRGSLCCV